MAAILLNGRIKTSVPIYISPAARARMGHSEGERNLVRAASNGEIMHGVSIIPSSPADGEISRLTCSGCVWCTGELRRFVLDGGDARGPQDGRPLAFPGLSQPRS